MRVLIGDSWRDGWLDYHRHASEVRITVRAWAVLAPVDDQYFVRPRDWRLIWNYFCKLGPTQVWRKIRSRARESDRNQKFIAIGLGLVEEADDGALYRVGTRVAFLACNHPRCVDRVAIDTLFVRPAPMRWTEGEDGIEFLAPFSPSAAAAFAPYAGWSRVSAVALEIRSVAPALDAAASTLLETLQAGVSRRLGVSPRSMPKTRVEAAASHSLGAVSCVLFGLGNYAKTVILPNLDAGVRIDCLHEVDPLQLGRIETFEGAVDTAGEPASTARYAAWFIAGYHHTHTPLAVQALKAGAHAVVEKPLATTEEQLALLSATLKANPGRLHACFQRRYFQFNIWARSDLGAEAGVPIDYRCIVYEVPLPARHWYRWPASGSRLISNGCHWIDHFLFLNGFAAVSRAEVSEAANGDVLVLLELTNTAVFSLTLTDRGSARLGVRDYVELSTAGRCVRITDARDYFAEDDRRVLRRARVNPMQVYADMYRAISHKIARGEPGEAIESLTSTAVTLRLEALLQQSRARRGASV